MKSTVDEKQLLLQMSRNDRAAFEVIYRRYWEELYDAACRRLRNSAQAEDIVQNIFVRLWLRRSDLQVENLSAYLHTAVRYNVYNYVSRDLVAESFYEPFEAINACPASADEAVLEKELLHLADAYIASLPVKRQRIFTLYFNDNLSTEEIADRLSISRKTVQNQLGTAINGLKAQLLPLVIFLICLLHLPK